MNTIKLNRVGEFSLSNYYNKQETDNLLKEKLSTDELDNAIDQALLEAKESGDFKGDTAMVNLSVVDNKLVITNVELSQNNADERRY